MDKATKFSLWGFGGSFVTVAAAVVNAVTRGAYGPALLTVMLAGAVFALVMIVTARLERRRVRKEAEGPKPNAPTMRLR